MKDADILLNLDKKLSAIIALLAYSLNEKMDKSNDKVEVILNNAGIQPVEISKLINKNLAAVQKTIQRSRK